MEMIIFIQVMFQQRQMMLNTTQIKNSNQNSLYGSLFDPNTYIYSQIYIAPTKLAITSEIYTNESVKEEISSIY